MGLIEAVVKKEIQELHRIRDTFDERFTYLRLDKNERILPFSPEQLEDFKRRIESDSLSGYAELGPLYRKLAAYLGVGQEQILLAAGSDLAIKSVFEACVGPGDHVVLHAPCYVMYKIYASMFGASVSLVPVTQKWEADIDAMLASVRRETKIFSVEVPNGFVGTSPSLAQIERCADELARRDVILIVDEAYHYVHHGFSPLPRLLDRHPNLIISQTFSKCHGLAGCRFGYLIGHPRLIEAISRVRPMHEISSLTALAAEWVLDHSEMLLQYQKENKASKEYLNQELAKLDIPMRDTQANFILLYLPDEGRTKDISRKLREQRILIRRPFEEAALKGWSRVCVGSVADSKRLVASLTKILA